MRKILFKLIAVFFILTSCNNPNEKLSILLKSPEVDRENRYEVYVSKKLNITVPKTKFCEYHEFAIYRDSLFYGVHITNSLNIDVYNLVNESFAYDIKVPEYLVKTNKIMNLFIQTPDSIFFQESFPPSVLIINSKGDLIKRFNIENNFENFENNADIPGLYTFHTIIGYIDPIFNSSKNLLYLIMHPIGAHNSRGGYKNTYRVGVYDIEKANWLSFFGRPEGIMKFKGKLFYNYDLSIPYFLIVNDTAFITYPMDHYIYIYDISSGELIYKKAGNSQYCNKLPNPLKTSKIRDTQAAWNFRIQIPFYGPLFYNSKMNMFTRIFHFRQPLKDVNGKLNSGKNRKGSIIIFDKDMNIVGETVFKNGSLGILKSLPLSDGILMARQPHYWQSDDTLVYRYKYEIRLIKQSE